MILPRTRTTRIEIRRSGPQTVVMKGRKTSQDLQDEVVDKKFRKKERSDRLDDEETKQTNR